MSYGWYCITESYCSDAILIYLLYHWHESSLRFHLWVIFLMSLHLQVDNYIGKNHLFKRSIILIKAWCYYESRILGAHYGLISTYVLEMLILYVFHFFHSSLDGPLAVLYRFLDYLSKFDWENYCISLNGPVCKSSLPDIVAKAPENGRDDLLLSEEFIRNCVEMFSVPAKGYETNLRAFSLKHLNLINPLKQDNNLGRSVSRSMHSP
ncbi:uncharacterized protein LOC103963046 [Pyrus x bretschneideri]|uniref:uncharacterized protein LOC103963046 n=1 Tax=Pyrus x bretschneideri TaxID=225117 RepID=UPI00202F559A|nr:uncharacterized protein LOC103963046 [Pyrus x bretschneideri]